MGSDIMDTINKNDKSTSADFEYPLLEVIKRRRSVRSFDARLIEREKINSLFEAARWAPSSVNEQPWRYIYATRDQPLWTKIFETLNEGNQIWVKNAPLLVASFTLKNFSRNDRPNNYSKYDLGAANAFLSLQAAGLGLQVHQIGGYNGHGLRQNLQVPEDYELGALIAIGYPGAPESLPENLLSRELAPRQRNKQHEFVMNKTFE